MKPFQMVKSSGDGGEPAAVNLEGFDFGMDIGRDWGSFRFCMFKGFVFLHECLACIYALKISLEIVLVIWME